MNKTILEKLNSQVEKTVLSGKQFGSSLQKIKNQLMKGGVLKQTGGKKINKTPKLSNRKTKLSNRKTKLSNKKNKLTNSKKTKNKKRKVKFSKNK